MQYLSKEELTRLLQIARKQSELHWLMILVAFRHGLRATEVVSMRGNQIKDGYLIVQRLKHSLKTTQPLFTSTEPLFDEKEALETRAKQVGTGILFPWSRQWFWSLIKAYGKAAGIPAHKTKPHVLKHSCAMLSIKEAGIENVRQWLGHKSIASTGEYLKVTDEEAAKVIQGAMKL